MARHTWTEAEVQILKDAAHCTPKGNMAKPWSFISKRHLPAMTATQIRQKASKLGLKARVRHLSTNMFHSLLDCTFNCSCHWQEGDPDKKSTKRKADQLGGDGDDEKIDYEEQKRMEREQECEDMLLAGPAPHHMIDDANDCVGVFTNKKKHCECVITPSPEFKKFMVLNQCSSTSH